MASPEDDQRGFFTVIFGVILTVAEILAYLALVVFLGLACLVWLVVGNQSDRYMSLIFVGFALAIAIGCRSLRKRINRAR